MLEISEITPNSISISHLDLAPSEERIIQSHGGLDRILVSELHVSESLRMTVIFVAEDRHPKNTVNMNNVFRRKDRGPGRTC